MIKVKLELQTACTTTTIPTKQAFQQWVKAALCHEQADTYEICIRLVDKTESQQLNKQYRHKDKPTNVLSFSYGKEALPLLGDLVICSDVVIEEAQVQEKLIDAHWAHLTVHGVLHLLGYDHEQSADAEIMEAKEIEILANLGFKNPY